jgi:hypothetical protein
MGVSACRRMGDGSHDLRPIDRMTCILTLGVSHAETPIRPYAHTFLQRAGTIGATKPTLNASDEQICSPVYEAIRDYWIDSRLGPGYSPH